MPTSDAWLETDSDAWISLSARLQRIVAARSGRTDVVVRIAPRPSTTPSAWSRLYRQDIAEVLLDARDLLRPEEIGVRLTEGFMMDPEATVSALVFHHPDCAYFTADETETVTVT